MIDFRGPDEIDAFAGLPQGACVVWGDLRSPAFLPLLRPAPTQSDHADERRPGASDRAYFLARRAATRSLVARALGCEADGVIIAYDGPGAPRVKSHTCEISVAGRGPFVAIAVSSEPVGVDLEIIREDVEIIQAVLHPVERASLRDMSAAEARLAFLEIWTAKEAYLKALGAGFNVDPSTFAVAIEEGCIRSISHAAPNAIRSGAVLHREIGGHAVIIAAVGLRR